MYKSHYITLSFLSSIFLSSFSVQSYLNIEEISAIESEAVRWKNTYVEKLNTHEIQVLANELYLLYAGALLDVTLRTQIVAATNNICTIQQHILSGKEQAEQLIAMHTFVNQLANISRAHRFITGALNTCDNFIDSLEADHALVQSIQALRAKGIEYLQRYAQHKEPRIKEQIQHTQTILHELHKKISLIVKTFQGLRTGNMPLDVGEENQAIELIDYAARIAKHTDALHLNSMQATAQLVHEQTMLEEIGKIIYAAYYKVLYRFMIGQHIDTPLIFAPEGIISAENRTEKLQDPEKLAYNIQKLSIGFINIQ